MKTFYKTLVILFALICLSGELFSADTTWVRVPTPTTKWLYRCAFPDSLNGWVVGDSGIIIHTTNSGATWAVQNSHIEFFIQDVFFLNSRLGWAIANDFFFRGSTILSTTNSGANWQAVRYPDTTVVIYTIYYLDSLVGYMGGYFGVILKTTNSGSSWFRVSSDSSYVSNFPINKFAFLNPQYGLACGGIIDVAGVVWFTTNYGLNWKSFSTAPEPLNDIMWRDSQNAYVAGGDYEFGGSFLHSSNKGIDWAYIPTNIFGVGQAVTFRTYRQIWIPLGFSQRYAISEDTGRTWTEYLVPDTCAFYDMYFADSLRGWTIGTNGAVYRYNSPIIGINQQQNNVPLTIKLNQNYPNPFNPSTTISYSVSNLSWVKITLYDVTGRIVRVLMNDIRTPGDYKLKFDASGLSSGVYFYALEAGKYSQTRKMVLLK